MINKNKKIIRWIRLSEDTDKQLKTLAKRLKISIAACLRHIIEEYFSGR